MPVTRLALVAVLCVCFFCSAVQSQTTFGLQGQERSNRPGLNPPFNSEYAIIYVDGIIHSQLADAIQACPQTCWIIDSFPETFSTNPFYAAGPKSVRVTLGRGTWMTTVPLILPTKSQLEGSGRGDGDFSGTVIQAANSFPQNSPMIEMGNTSPSMGVRIENLTIDCNNLSGVTGVHNDKSQEQSGLHHVLIENIAGIGLDVEGSGAQNSGPYEDLEFAGGENANVTIASLCARVVNVPAFRGIHGATCNFNNYSVHPRLGIQMDSTGTLSDIHIEGVENGIGLGVLAPGTGAILQNIYGGGLNITNVVHIYKGQNILLSGLVRSTTANLLVDDVLGQTITDTELALYIIGNGASPNQSRFSSSIAQGAQSLLANLTVSNLSVLNAMPQLSVGQLDVTNLDVTGKITMNGSPVGIQTTTGLARSLVGESVAGSPDPLNVYNGIAVLDPQGQAEVKLPHNFQPRTRGFQYQLTTVGGYAPVYVASEIKGNSFRIAGGTPGLKVSWAVTDIR
jgi:hypothetical protein